VSEERRRSHWGWGHEDQILDRAALEGMAGFVRERLGFGGEQVEDPVAADAVELAEPRLKVPDSLAEIVSAERHERLSHSMGKAYRDVVRGFRGRFERTPDMVARPRDEEDVRRVLELCSDMRLAAIPYGGGTSVVGGVEPRVGHGYRGCVTVDLSALDRVLEVDQTSLAARVQAGVAGPDLDRQLGEHGLTARFYPQSFEYATLGGWIATRAGGHFATVRTHIDDFVESIRAVTPSGTWESRRLPGSGAGPSPDRMLLGSEGILGLITEAWLRVRRPPTWKASCAVRFDSFAAGAEAVRALAQSDLDPANCRLLDPVEAGVVGISDGSDAVLMLGFESSFGPIEGRMSAALECVEDLGGRLGEVRHTVRAAAGGVGETATAAGQGGGERRAAGEGSGDTQVGGGPEDPVDDWRATFLAAPYLRNSFVALGVIAETFETAITWDRFGEFHQRVEEAARRSVAEVTGAPPDGPGSPKVGCRFTHVYPDGPAPYYTVLAPARRGSEVEQWDEIKAAVSEAIGSAGGTITHHHAVGRDHRPAYDLQRPEPFAEALRAAKAAVDPDGILNPGVLIDPA